MSDTPARNSCLGPVLHQDLVVHSTIRGAENFSNVNTRLTLAATDVTPLTSPFTHFPGLPFDVAQTLWPPVSSELPVIGSSNAQLLRRAGLHYEIMARKKKIAANGLKPGRAPVSKAAETITKIEKDTDSDTGSFLDDDSMDFLHAGLVHGKKQRAAEIRSQVTVAVNLGTPMKEIVSVYTAKHENIANTSSYLPSSAAKGLDATAIPFVQGGNTPPKCASASISPPKNDESPLVAKIDSDAAAQKTAETARQITAETSDMVEESDAHQNVPIKTVAVSRLQVPISMTAQYRNSNEGLQDEIRTLKRDIAKKDREVKSANRKAATAEIAKGEAEDELQSIRQILNRSLQSNPRRAAELIELRKERDDIEGQRKVATSELKKQRDKDEVFAARLVESGKKLSVQAEKSKRLEAEVNTVQIEKCGLDMANTKLTRATKTGELSRHRMQQSLRLEEQASSTLRDKCADLTSKLATVTSSRDTSTNQMSAMLQKLQRSLNKVTNDLEGSVRARKEMERDMERLHDDCDRLGKNRAILRRKLTEVEAQNSKNAQDLLEARNEINELKSTRDSVEPILKIGVDIRLRNMEWAREPVLGVATKDIDRARILNGNIAAHRANGAVDAVMFEAGLVPEEFIEEASNVYEKLFNVKPSSYKCWSSKVLRLLDCRATVTTLKAMNRATITTNIRHQHSQIDTELCRKHTAMTPSDFEGSSDVDDLLVELEELTESIVDTERNRGGYRKRTRRTVSSLT